MNNKFRKLFPIFIHQKNLVYLDSSGTSLKPKTVIQAISNYYEKYSINTHSEGSSFLAQAVRQIIHQTRQLIAQRINGTKEEVVIFPSTTYSLNILALSLKNYLQRGDKIFLTHLEHSSNCYPWQAIAQKKGAQVDFLPLTKNFIIDIDKLENYIDKKTKIVSFSHMSNSLGVINPVAKITQKIKEINPNCLVIIDACQRGGKKKSPKEKSNYVLPLAQKFEVGTLPLAQIFGLQASFEFLNNLDIKEVSNYEKELKNYAISELKKLEKITIYNKDLETIDIVLFNLQGYHAHDVVEYLGKNNILVRGGNFCCPYLKELIGVESAIRISLFIYNTKDDLDKLVHSLKNIIKKPELLMDNKKYKDTLLLPKTSLPLKNFHPTETEKKFRPPYANGKLHIGHFLNFTIKDIIVRFQASQGRYTPFLLEQVQIQKEQLKKLGLFTDFEKYYITLDKEYEAEQIRVFGEMVKKGLIYQGFRPIYWSCGHETALAEAEIEYYEKKDTSLYFKIKLAERGKLKVEKTFLGEKLLGIKYFHPYQKDIKRYIVDGSDFIEEGEGTGIVHLAPAFGAEDFAIAKKEKLAIECPLEPNGIFNEKIRVSELVGVPIPVLYQDDKPILESKIIDYIADLISEKGSKSYFNGEILQLSQQKFPQLINEKTILGQDTMDVWFDSGVSH
ncbi:4946_t:CDS:2, partial [Funneliformis geosporum]